MTSLKAMIICSVLFVLIFADVACAYLDPGTGSYLFQMLLAGLVGAAVTVRLFWQHIKLFFSRIFSRRRNTKDDD